MQIISADARHLPAIVNILNHYILNSYARFETMPLSVEGRREWFSQFLDDSTPACMLIAQEGNDVLGFAGAQRYREGEAFRQTLETTIYLAPAYGEKRGLGSQLYGELFERLSGQDLHRALAGIALPNAASVALHEKFGFERVGVFDQYACKNGRYISTVWMQKPLGKS
ncbi:GNAT family N-acetyltransferase [Salinicola rhizosphaerae]|uniref:N-acetyltransferase n=1 Tax=Salinicola rhizosphaerae TaxID=1443141 RepID=A0ABQ3E3R1_9GAMM|nr:GNAT family N-acetyltransferase [Salinicola rhizosphaerae]GHB22387.1 N-acetyltransferase [Salinicola rhizosphaerae]